MIKKAGREKIAVFNTSFFNVSQTFIWQQVNILSRFYDIHLIGMAFMNPHNFKMDDWKKCGISRAPGIINRITNRFLGHSFLGIRSYWRLYHLFRKNKFKAVHVHFGTNALLILPVARFFRVPLIVTFHGADASRMTRNTSYMKRMPKLFSYASAIIIVSRHMMDTLKLERWKDKVHTIPCTVDPVEFVPLGIHKSDTRQSENGGAEKSNVSVIQPAGEENSVINSEGAKPLRIVHIGRITPKKGVPDIILAFSSLAVKYAGIELHIIGDGEEYDLCLSLVKKNKLEDRVFFHGAVPHNEIYAWMQSADIYVLNSRVADDGDMEGTPVTLLEAMCLQKAVVSTLHAGIPDVIRDRENGLLVNEKDNIALQSAIEELITNDFLRLSLGAEARKTVLESYTAKEMEIKLKKVFNSF